MEVLIKVILEGLHSYFGEERIKHGDLRSYLTKVKRIPKEYVLRIIHEFSKQEYIISIGAKKSLCYEINENKFKLLECAK